MISDALTENYIYWLMSLVSDEDEKYDWRSNYMDLIRILYYRPFVSHMRLDENRESDGLDLREQYADVVGCPRNEIHLYLNGPCSILEMLVALSLRVEDTIMIDLDVGPRPGKWFWTMLTNLELEAETDDRIDEVYVNYVLDMFLDRKYTNTRGGLFRIRDNTKNLNTADIWMQFNWYLCELYL